MRHGWRTEGVGKIFFTPAKATTMYGFLECGTNRRRWSNNAFCRNSADGKLTREEALFSNQRLGEIGRLPRGAAWEIAETPDNSYSDGRTADEGIARLRAAKTHPETPFFLALGFVKPHLPFCAPKRYWDMHNRAQFQPATRHDPPNGAPAYAGKTVMELNQYEPVPNQPPLADDLQRTLIHGYYAATSYMDAQVGRVLDELDKLGYATNTLVVLWGDHGWHLGDHGAWTKHTNYEQANRIPLIIAGPGVARGSTRQLAETVDLYPTLAALCQLSVAEVPQPLDGLSLVPVLRDPAVRIRNHAYHAFPRQRAGELVIGRAIRTERYRLVEWKKPGAAAETADLELYDYVKDPEETKNLAASQKETVRELRHVLAGHPEAKAPLK